MATHWDPKDKIILVTGGAAGLGSFYTEWFLKEGAKNVAILDVAIVEGYKLAEHLNKNYPERASFYKCDVSDEDELVNVFADVVTKFGQVDVIINNAGILNENEGMWRKCCRTNFEAVVSLTYKGVEHMRKDKGGAGGTIINVSSVGAFTRIPFIPVYSSTKAAIILFSQNIAVEPFYEQTGIRVMTICLGPTSSNMLDNLCNNMRNSQFEELFANFISLFSNQKPGSAADALIKMYKEGKNNSVWITQNDTPGKDITSIFDEVFKTLEKSFDKLVSTPV